MKKGIFFLLFLLICFLLNITVAFADTFGTIDNPEGVNVRKGPGTDTEILDGIEGGEEVTILEEVTNKAGNKWYKVKYGSLTGYVLASLVSEPYDEPKSSSDSGSSRDSEADSSDSDSSDWSGSYTSADFPESYRPYIDALSTSHPTWNFVADYTGLSWDDVITKELTHPSTNLVPNSYPEAYKSKSALAYDPKTKTYTIFDSRDWVAASQAAVRFYMDPRNNMDQQSVFQFLSTTYNADIQTKDELNELISGSFLDNEFPEEGYETYADLIMEAGKESGVSPLSLASMMIVEQGYNGATDSISGKSGYFNYFNIGAYLSGGKNAVENGLIYAENAGWNTRVKAIKEGAKWYAERYVNSGQYTLYLKRFNVMAGLDSVGTGQYMTNVRGAKTEGISLSDGYLSFDDYPLTFHIPVYNDMPDSPEPEPSVPEEPEIPPEEEATEEPEAEGEIKTALLPGKSFDEYVSGLDAKGGSIKVFSIKGEEVKSGTLATGMEVAVFDAKGKETYRGTLVVKGDNNGDGKVNSADALRVQRYSVKTLELNEYQIAACDINKDGRYNSADALLMQRFSVGTYEIKE